MLAGKGVMLVAMLGGTLFFGGMAAMMTWMMASGAMGPGHMWGWGRSSSPQTPVVSQADQFTVEMRDFSFRPNDLTVRAGTQVTWVNRDGAPHDATAEDNSWKTERLFQGDQYSIPFDSPGVYPYRCTIHPQMKGTVRVQ